MFLSMNTATRRCPLQTLMSSSGPRQKHASHIMRSISLPGLSETDNPNLLMSDAREAVAATKLLEHRSVTNG